MPENHLNFHLKDQIYYVCLLKTVKSLWSETNLIVPLQNATDNKFALEKKSSKIPEPSILQSFHVVWNPYILNNICHSKPYQLDILLICNEYFPDII